MKIQWFPGHMNKARKELAALLPGADLVLEVLDARIPFSTANPMLHQMRRDKPVLTVMARDDLADPDITALWLAALAPGRARILALNLKAEGSTEPIPDLCRLAAPGAARRPGGVRVLVVGIPNAGKSTLINALAGRKVAKTGNEPAVTRHQQRVSLGRDIELFDTPGVLWPNVENRQSGYRLALTGAIRETAYDECDVALFGMEFLLVHYPERLRARFDLGELPASPEQALDAVGQRRGAIGRGGIVDFNRAARLFLTDLRSGALGRLSFETPDMIEKEMQVVETERAERKARKEARKQRRNPSSNSS